jgi:hypothetical protein
LVTAPGTVLALHPGFCHRPWILPCSNEGLIIWLRSRNPTRRSRVRGVVLDVSLKSSFSILMRFGPTARLSGVHFLTDRTLFLYYRNTTGRTIRSTTKSKERQAMACFRSTRQTKHRCASVRQT